MLLQETIGSVLVCKSILVHSGACLPTTVYICKLHYVKVYKRGSIMRKRDFIVQQPLQKVRGLCPPTLRATAPLVPTPVLQTPLAFT